MTVVGMDVVVHSDDFGQRCVLLFTDIDIPAVLGISLPGEQIVMGIPYFGIVTYQFEETLEFLYFVVGYGSLGLIGIYQQIVGRDVLFVVQRGYFGHEVYRTRFGLRVVVRAYLREVVAEREIGVFIFSQFLFHLLRKYGIVEDIDTQQVFFPSQVEHFQFLVVEVYQNSVYVVEFDAHRKVLVDVVQKPFALLQHLRGG